MIRTVLRLAAGAIALAAVIDPAFRSIRPGPLPVTLRTSDGRLAPAATAPDSSLRRRLEQAMPGELAINTAAEPAALVVDGTFVDPESIPDRLPVSFVAAPLPAGPRVRVASVDAPRPVLPGWSASVTATIDGRDMRPGTSSAIVLEHHGVEVERTVHRWSRANERVAVPLAFVPPAPGGFAVTVKVLPIEGADAVTAAAAPVQVLAEARRLRVLAFDPRPSWGSGFVRRTLEADPSFDVITRVRASRGPEVRTGAAPMVLDDASLAPFDLALVGAPEDLSGGELNALERFAVVRGGTVVFVADRRSGGGYLRLLGVPGLEETLLDKPITVSAADGTALRASEFAYPPALPVGAEPLARIPHGSGERSPVLSVPAGAGLLIFSGLLDSWRYRADDDGTFDAFWRSRLATAAARAPRPLELTLTPGVAAPGSRVRLRAAVRATEQVTTGTSSSVPAIEARVIDQRGTQQHVRLWPTASLGVFEGEATAGPPGRYDVRADTASGITADAPLIVSLAGPDAGSGDPDLAAVLSAATGGVAARADNLRPLVDQLRALPRAPVERVVRPFRSALWTVAFASLLTAEWALRRRRGLR